MVDIIEVKKEIQIGDIILEKGDKIRVIEGNRIEEKGPISKEGALKFVFKLPKEGKFTAEFLDGSSTTIDVDSDDKSSGAYAFIGKDNGKIFQTWDSKPSRKEAHKVLQRVKSF